MGAGASAELQVNCDPQGEGRVQVRFAKKDTIIEELVHEPLATRAMNYNEGNIEASANATLLLQTRSFLFRAPAASAGVQGAARAMPSIALLQATPLINADQPVDLLDLKAERDAIVASLQRAGRSVQLLCDACTTKRLRALLTEGYRMLHYSGHGVTYTDRAGQQRGILAFEDGLGGTHALEVEKLTDLVKAGADEVASQSPSRGHQPLQLCFVSACHSVQGGEAFVAAGVPHVVAVRREAQLQDKAACAFADQFYFAIFRVSAAAAGVTRRCCRTRALAYLLIGCRAVAAVCPLACLAFLGHTRVSSARPNEPTPSLPFRPILRAG